MAPTNTPRQQAKLAGKHTYDGRPCNKCGGTLRHVSDTKCFYCARDKQRAKRNGTFVPSETPPKLSAEEKRRRRNTSSLRHYYRNQERRKEYQRTYGLNNSEVVSVTHKRWMSSPAGVAYKKGRRAIERKRYKQATPNWLTKQQIYQIYQIYLDRDELSSIPFVDTPFEVDHIIPLNHPLVCGLHVPWNLQILSAEDNRRKSNVLDLDTRP